MTIDPSLLVAGAIGGLVGSLVAMAGGLLALIWWHRRWVRQVEEGCAAVDAASDRHDASYTRAELSRIHAEAKFGGRAWEGRG